MGSVEYFDESQGKPVQDLEETMVLSEETSYFLTTYDDLTKKINLLNFMRAITSDGNGDYDGMKFVNKDQLTGIINDIESKITDSDRLYHEFSKKMQELRAEMANTITSVNGIVARLEESLSFKIESLQSEFEKEIADLKEADQGINERLQSFIERHEREVGEIRTLIDTKVGEILTNITNTGDIAEGLANTINNRVNNLDTRITQIYNELRGQDEELSRRLEELANEVASTSSSLTNNYYDTEQMDAILSQIYNRLKVKLVTEEFDENGNKWDMNTLTGDGLYFFHKTSYVQNIPGSCVNGLLICISCARNVTKQIFMRLGTAGINDHQTYTRMMVNDNWTEWVRNITTKDIIWGRDIPKTLEYGQIYLQIYD